MKISLFGIRAIAIMMLAIGSMVFSIGAGAQNASRERTAATPAPTPTTTPTATPSPTPERQTIQDLQSRIMARLSRPETRRGTVGIKIVSLNSGKVVFEQNAEKYVMPASNMKNFTVAAALEKLTPDFRFVTSVYANSLPDASGTIKGDMRIYGRGDVSISTAFNNGDYYKGLDNLVDKIAAAGVKRIEGDVIGDETYFQGDPLPSGWEWDDLQWYYGAEISALPINDNAVDIKVSPGANGSACVVNLSPANPVYRINNTCVTSPRGTYRQLEVKKELDKNILNVSGTIPVGDSGFSGSIAVSHPAEMFLALLKQRLELRGITVTGTLRTINGKSPVSISTATQPQAPIEIAKLESPPFSVVAAKTLKPSQNMFTETILWTLGETARARTSLPTVGTATSTVQPPRRDSADLGLGETKAFRQQIGIPDDAVVQYDGSGLSRHDLITPVAVVQLYTYMAKQSRFAQVWRDSLTIGGVDGTLANRFKGTAAAGNVRGKTGTIDQVSALSGYVSTAAGEPLVFSIVVNGVPEGRVRTSLIDDVILSLANFTGRID